jgi:hypothetical protein
MAEGVGFEPTEVLPSTVFKTAAFDHSAIPPLSSKIVTLAFRSKMVNIYVLLAREYLSIIVRRAPRTVFRFCLHYVLTGLFFCGFEIVKKCESICFVALKKELK